MPSSFTPRRGGPATWAVLSAIAAAATLPAAAAAQVTFSTAGADAASVQGSVDAFRAALGDLNPNVPGSFAGGRREINWDGVPAAFSAPSAFPGDFFNGNTPGRARGAAFSTPGSGFQVSANAGEGPVRFDNIDPSYSATFATFSPQKLFTAVGSTVTDVHFFVPGTGTRAVTSAFGVVFTDVDLANTTSLEFFGTSGASLGTYFAPQFVGSQSFSFLGVQFDAAQVARVRITSGNAALGAGVLDGTNTDVVAMDDFIFGEAAQVVPEPGTWALLAVGLTALGGTAVARRRATA